MLATGFSTIHTIFSIVYSWVEWSITPLCSDTRGGGCSYNVAGGGMCQTILFASEHWLKAHKQYCKFISSMYIFNYKFPTCDTLTKKKTNTHFTGASFLCDRFFFHIWNRFYRSKILHLKTASKLYIFFILHSGLTIPIWKYSKKYKR